MNFALKCWYFQCYNARILTAKLSPYYFTYSLFNLRFYNRTITRFIADDKVVYQWVRWEMRLASDNSWARRRLKHLSWRSQWIILCTLEQRMTVSCEISRADRCLFGLSTWLTATRRTRSIPLPACRTIVSVLWILSSRLSMLPTFQPLSGNSLSVFCAPFWQIEILNQNLIFLWNFHDFVEFLQIVRSRQFPKVK